MEFARIFEAVKLVSDGSLREKAEQVWLLGIKRGGWTMDEVFKIPFTLLIPNTRISIIEHTRAVTDCALKIAACLQASYAQMAINRDHLIAGGLLHDVGKLLEYERIENGYRTSRNGSRLRHPVSGANLASECGLPDEVVHIIYTHSKEGDGYERSIESIIIHHSDFLNFEPLRKMAHG